MRICLRRPRDREHGFVVLIIIVLLAILAALAVGNNVALSHLKRELRLTEQRQLQRVGFSPATNQPPLLAPASSGNVEAAKPRPAGPAKEP